MTLGEYLAEAPFGLAMSSGFFSFYAHTGFLRALEEASLRPARVSGSSAGALVGATWAAGVDAPTLAAELEGLERKHFWDPALGAGLLRGQLFLERMERLTRKKDFSATRVPAAVSVFDVRSRKTHVIAHGAIANAVVASCSVPLLFHPMRIEGRAYLDGGILDRAGLEGMPPNQERVLFHHIVSKSPWRPRNDLPSRPGMTTMWIAGLPRSGPFKLEDGRKAYRLAFEATRRALDQPIVADRVIVSA